MASKHLYTDGKEIKTIDPWHSDGPMWNYGSGRPDTPDDELYARVAAVYRAINFTADTLSNMPFAIVKDASGDEVDSSEEYKNVVGFLPYPRQLLRLMVQSFLVTNKAFAFQESKGRTVTNLRYIAPGTIQITTDPATGAITKFTRTLGTTRTDYPVDKNGFSNIVYCFNLNWKNELLPDDQSPFKAMMNAAGIGFYADTYIRNFFSRGGIKPTILTFDGVMDPTSMERVEGVWTKIVTGYYRFLGKVFNGKFTPTVIGDGIDNLKDSTVYDNAMRNIAIAIGMPQDALLQNADSYATAQVHKSTWFSDTLTPLSQALAEPLNDQVFKRLGYRFEFRPETADPDMEEERQRIASAEVLFNILSKANRVDADKAALEALGIDLPQWFKWEEKEPEPVVLAPGQAFAKPGEPNPFGGGGQAPKVDAPRAKVSDGKESKAIEVVQDTPSPVAISVPALREMQNWQDLAFRKLKKSLPLSFEWEARDIPSPIADGIRARLAEATDEAGIKAAFEVATDENVVATNTPAAAMDNEIKTLADALNNMAAAMTTEVKAEPIITPAPSFTVNLTAQMPAVGEPTITVNIPDQPAPVVNVTNNVEPTPVTVQNNVTTQPADVTVSAPKSAAIVRDNDGRITGIRTK